MNNDPKSLVNFYVCPVGAHGRAAAVADDRSDTPGNLAGSRRPASDQYATGPVPQPHTGRALVCPSRILAGYTHPRPANRHTRATANGGRNQHAAGPFPLDVLAQVNTKAREEEHRGTRRKNRQFFLRVPLTPRPAPTPHPSARSWRSRAGRIAPRCAAARRW